MPLDMCKYVNVKNTQYVRYSKILPNDIFNVFSSEWSILFMSFPN